MHFPAIEGEQCATYYRLFHASLSIPCMNVHKRKRESSLYLFIRFEQYDFLKRDRCSEAFLAKGLDFTSTENSWLNLRAEKLRLWLPKKVHRRSTTINFK